MSVKTKDTALLAASATAIAAIGLLASPVLAEAAPCTQYTFNGPFNLRQANGFRVEIANLETGESAYREGEAVAKPGGNPGRVTGNISGRDVVLDINWNGGVEGVYEGTVDDNGFVHGTTYDATHPPAKAAWDSETFLACKAAPPPAPPPPGKALRPIPIPVRVTDDVNVYERPNINNDLTALGILRAGSLVQPVGKCNPEDWCQVKGADVPTGQGFVWGHLQLPGM